MSPLPQAGSSTGLPVVDPPHPVERLLGDLAHDAEAFVRREPTKTMMLALATGVLLTVVPARFLVATVTAATVTVLRPTLLTLGVIKAVELCTAGQKTNPQLTGIS